jgi:hypothetical protein
MQNKETDNANACRRSAHMASLRAILIDIYVDIVSTFSFSSLSLPECSDLGSSLSEDPLGERAGGSFSMVEPKDTKKFSGQTVRVSNLGPREFSRTPLLARASRWLILAMRTARLRACFDLTLAIIKPDIVSPHSASLDRVKEMIRSNGFEILRGTEQKKRNCKR